MSYTQLGVASRSSVSLRYLVSSLSYRVETSGSLRTITKEELEAEKARTSKL